MSEIRTAKQAFDDVLDRRREALSTGTFRSVDESRARLQEDLESGRLEIAVERSVYVSSALEMLADVAGLGDDGYFRQLVETEEFSFAHEDLGRLVAGRDVFSDGQMVIMDKLGELFAVEKDGTDPTKARGLVVEIDVLCSQDDLASGRDREATGREEIDRIVADSTERRRRRTVSDAGE